MTSAHQYTRALLALTVTQACQDVLSPALAETPLADNSARLSRWLEGCRAKFPQRPLSAGARRDLDAAFAKLAEYVETNHLDTKARLDAWAANLWTAYSLVSDARITCKSVAHGQAWAYLDKTLCTLAVKLSEMCPDAEAEGFEVYMNL